MSQDEKIALLRSSLIGLIGAENELELKQLEAGIRLMPAPAADKAAMIDGIHALLATMPNAGNQEEKP